MAGAPRIFTVGHSTRTSAELLALLRDAAIELLIDVRRFPASRRHPHFAGAALEASLRSAGIAYRHEPDLGGHRKPRGGTRNAGLNEEPFRAYADHMASPAFRRAVDRLRRDACARTSVVMCAEASPERCHRKLLADHLASFGLPVVHLLRPDARAEHRISPLARVGADGLLRYPEPGGRQLDLFGGGGA
jgi:uncharacterized protein (DUF488 family)